MSIKQYFMPVLFFIFCIIPCYAGAGSAKPSMPDISEEFDGWRVMPVRSKQEYLGGMIGGEAEQHNQGIARSVSNPDVIYLSHDCGQVWRSDDSGKTWNKPPCKNMYVVAGQSIEVDPADEKTVFVLMDNSWDWMHKDYQGIYRSDDGGDTWQFVLPVKTDIKNSRRYQHNIAYDPTTTTDGRTKRWYAAVTNDWLYRTDDRGTTWHKVSELSSCGHIYSIMVHPSDGKTIFLATEKGLFEGKNQGRSIEKTGDLPAGAVSSIAIDSRKPTAVYVVLKGLGLYRSDDGGRKFILVRKFKAEHVFINPLHPDAMYLAGSYNTMLSTNGGKKWKTVSLSPAPGLGRDYKKRMGRPMTGIVPDPRNPLQAVAYSTAAIWRTDDGISFRDSSALFTGYNCGWWNHSIGFDLENPNRFAIFNADVGMAITENRGNFFYRRGVPKKWRTKAYKKIPWTSMHSAALQPGTKTIIAAVGNTWKKKLVKSNDSGITWEIINSKLKNYLFISFHPQKKNIVYADDMVSEDGGLTFMRIPYLAEHKASVLDFCFNHADTVYAMDKKRKTIFRSDDCGKTWRVYVAAAWSFARHDSKPTFSAHASDPDIIYTIDKSGDLAVFDGKKWNSVGVLDLAGSEKPKNYVRSVVVDVLHPEVIYAGMFAPGTETVWRSTDSGKTWKNISYNLPRLGVSGMNINPHSGELFIGGCAGTWVFPPPYKSSNLIYPSLVSRPSCHDDLKNGNELGIDCGGSCRQVCE